MLKQCTEQCLTTKPCMHAEISPQHTKNLLLLAKSNLAYVLSLLICYGQDFRKDADNLVILCLHYVPGGPGSPVC